MVLVSLLVVYTGIVSIASSPVFDGGDEGGYAAYAMRIAGVPETSQDLRLWWGAQDLRYWWGPGYPLLLAPFALFGWPWLAAKLLNALFLSGAIAYAGALVYRYTPGSTWLAVMLSLGLYPPLMRSLPSLNPESLTVLLVCGFMFHFCALFQQTRRFRLHLFATSIYLAYLALTKIFFGYVIAAMLVFLLVSRLWQRTHGVRTASKVFLLGLLWCVPYLLYMYSVTGKVFYWGTSGGMSLYWMSTPYPGEYGSWYSSDQVKERPELAPHREFFATLEGLSDVERDDAFKKRAFDNIAHHPKEFARNWAANVGRMLFSYPFSFAAQSLTTYFYLAPNMFLVVLFLMSLIPAALRPRAVPFELWFLLAFSLIALAGSTLVSGYDRQFRPLVPILCVWVAFVAVRVLRIDLRPWPPEESRS
jgi:hypothetical protein